LELSASPRSPEPLGIGWREIRHTKRGETETRFMVDGTEFFLLAVAGLTAYALGLFKLPAPPPPALPPSILPGEWSGGAVPDPYAEIRAHRLDCIGRNGRWDDATLTCQPGPSLDPCAFLTGKAKIRCQESGIVPLPSSLRLRVSPFPSTPRPRPVAEAADPSSRSSLECFWGWHAACTCPTCRCPCHPLHGR